MDSKGGPLRNLALALWFFAALNAVDLALTLWGLSHGLTEGAPATSRIVAAFGPLGLVALKGIVVGGTWALTWPLARRYRTQLPRPLAWIVGAVLPARRVGRGARRGGTRAPLSILVSPPPVWYELKRVF